MLVHCFLFRHCRLEVERSGTGRRQWRRRGPAGARGPYHLGFDRCRQAGAACDHALGQRSGCFRPRHRPTDVTGERQPLKLILTLGL